jgi:hypothetical protein
MLIGPSNAFVLVRECNRYWLSAVQSAAPESRQVAQESSALRAAGYVSEDEDEQEPDGSSVKEGGEDAGDM